jgi:hypothetical protein
MDSRGDIFDADAVQAMSDAKRSKLVMIPKDQEAAVRLMNRKQRRAWYAQQRRSIKDGKVK